MPNWPDVIQRANTDAQFRNRLKADPAAACKEVGVQVPAGSVVKVVDEGDNELHLFLNSTPPVPKLKEIIDRARRDEAFKKRLLANPRRCVEETLGEPLPAAMRIQVHDPQPGEVLLVLTRPSALAGELSDQQLEAVAGGGLLKRIGYGIRDLFCRDTPATGAGSGWGYASNSDGTETVHITMDNSPGTEDLEVTR